MFIDQYVNMTSWFDLGVDFFLGGGGGGEERMFSR